MNLTLLSTQKFIRTLAQNNGLTVVFSEEDSGMPPCTDGKRIIVTKPNPAWNDEELTEWEHAVYHELGHNLPAMRDCFATSKKHKVDMTSLLGMTLNLVDDHRQEHYRIDEYEGRKSVIDRSVSNLTQGIIDKLKADPDTSTEENYAKDLLLSAFTWDSKLRAEWLPSMAGKYDQLYDTLSPKQKTMCDSLAQFDDELREIETAEQEYNLVKRMVDATGGDSEKEEKHSQEGYENKRKQEEEAEGKAAKDSEEKGNGEEGERGKRDKAAYVLYEDLVHDKHEETSRSFAPLRIDYSNYEYGKEGYTPSDPATYRVHDYTKDKSATEDGSAILADTSYSGLAAQIRKLLIIKSKSKYQFGKKRGKLHNKNIYRTCLRNR